MSDILDKASQIKMLLLDVDGVMTDGSINTGENGELFKRFNVKDGLGVRWLSDNNIKVGIITGRQSAIVDVRAAEIGIEIVIQGSKNKLVDMQSLAETHQLSLSQIAFMGDDLPDLEVLSLVGLGLAPADAVQQIKDGADWVSESEGGRGAVREAAELILKSQGLLDEILGKYG